MNRIPCLFSPEACVDRVDSLLAMRHGYGAGATGGAGGEMTRIDSLDDGSLLAALTDDVPRWIYFAPALAGRTWRVPAGRTALGPDKTIDGRDVTVTWQYGDPNNDVAFGSPTVSSPARVGRLTAERGNLIMVGIRHVGDLAWPYIYEPPYFSNGATDGLEIWAGRNYFIYKNDWERMSDESLGLYQQNARDADMITFSQNRFFETKTASLIGVNGINPTKSRITIVQNYYHEMVNGRAPGDFRNVFAHVVNNVVNYVNDEGIRVSENALVISERNVLDMGCNVAVSGPRFARGVVPTSPELGNQGVLHSIDDIVTSETSNCFATTDSPSSAPPAAPPFIIPTDSEYRNYDLQTGGINEVKKYVDENAGISSINIEKIC